MHRSAYSWTPHIAEYALQRIFGDLGQKPPLGEIAADWFGGSKSAAFASLC
jgi:hypothetical protein